MHLSLGLVATAGLVLAVSACRNREFNSADVKHNTGAGAGTNNQYDDRGNPLPPQPPLVEQASPDIVTLSWKKTAYFLTGSYGGPAVTTETCPSVDNGPHHGRTIDCTRGIEEAVAKHMPEAKGTLMQEGYTWTDGYGRPNLECYVSVIETATRAEAFRVSEGIGFHANMGKGRFVKSSVIQEVRRGRNKQGEEVIIHRFLMAAPCWLGSTSSSQSATWEFKPYVEFRKPGQVIRNWEGIEANWGVRSQAEGMNRCSELLSEGC